METLQSTIFIEFDVNTKKITFLRGDNIVDYDSNVTSIYARVKYKNLSGNTVYLTPSELEAYKFSLYTIKPTTNNVNIITGKVTDELKENVYGGVIKFEIPRACTNRLGIVKCEIHINQGNKIIGSSTFVLDVKQSLVTAFDDELLGDEDFPVLKQLILEIQKASNIDDNHRSKITTYSSNKIENIKEDLSSQIKEKATKEEVNIERKRIDTFTTLSQGSTTGDAELIDARIDSYGLIHANAGNAIRSIGRIIRKLVKEEDVIDSNDFTYGTYIIANNALNTDSSKIAFKNVKYAKYNTIISVEDDYQLYVYYHNGDGSYLCGAMDTWQSEPFVVPADKIYRLLIRKSDVSDLKPIGIEDVCKKVHIMRIPDDININDMKDCIDELDLNISELTKITNRILNYTQKDIINYHEFVYGTYYIDSDTIHYQTDRIMFKNVKYAKYKTTISVEDDYQLFVYYHSSDGSYLGNATENWQSEPFVVPTDKYYRLLIRKSDNADLSSIGIEDVCKKVHIVTMPEDDININDMKDCIDELDLNISELTKITNRILNYTQKDINNLVIDRNINANKLIQASKKYFDDSTIDTWDKNCKSDFLSIAHITDIHADTKRYKNFCNYIDNLDIIDCAICTGDFVVTPRDDEFAKINSVDHIKTIYPVVGNHDKSHGGYTKTTDEVYSLLNFPAGGKTYYSVDFTDKGIRLIVLNQYEDSVNKYSQTQIDWFVSNLEDAANNNLHVLVAFHSPGSFPIENDKGFYQRHRQWTDAFASPMGTQIEDIIWAYMNKKTYQVNFSDYSKYVDFTACNGTFIAYMCGHYHGDYIGCSSRYSDQLYLLCTCGACVPDISSPYNYGEEVSDLPRIENTESEDAFNVYTIDTKNKLIKIVRVGSSINDRLEKREFAIFNY